MTGRVAHFNDTSNCSIMSYASLCLLSFAARLSARLYNSIHSFFFRVCGIVAAGRSWPAGGAAGARPASLWRARPACAARQPLQSSLRRPRRLLLGVLWAPRRHVRAPLLVCAAMEPLPLTTLCWSLALVPLLPVPQPSLRCRRLLLLVVLQSMQCRMCDSGNFHYIFFYTSCL